MTLLEVVMCGALMLVLGTVLFGLLAGHASVFHSSRLRAQTYLGFAAAAAKLEEDLRPVQWGVMTSDEQYGAGPMNKLGFPTPVDATGRVVLDDDGEPVYQAYLLWYGHHNHLLRRRVETGPFHVLSVDELRNLCNGEGTDLGTYSGSLKLYHVVNQAVVRFNFNVKTVAANGLKDEQFFSWVFYAP